MQASQRPSSHRSEFNCVTAAVYNALTQVHALSFPAELIYPLRWMMHVCSYQEYLVTMPPDVLLRDSLGGIGAELEFPGVGDVQGAIDYADAYLREQGPISVNVNLRYDVLEPLPFDNDEWHYQLITARRADGAFAMYDQFEDKEFVYPEARFRQAIDTPFNYGWGNGFSPFMLVKVHSIAQTQGLLLGRKADLVAQLIDSICRYPLQENLDQGRRRIEQLRRYTTHKPGAEAMYRIMNGQVLLAKIRQAMVDCLVFAGIGAHEKLQHLTKRWLQHKDCVGLSLMRRCNAEWDALANKYRDLILLEQSLLQQIVEIQMPRTSNGA